MKGRPLTEYIMWDSKKEMDLVTWIWSFVAVRLTITSVFDKAIGMRQTGYAYSPSIGFELIQPGETSSLSYPGYTVTFESYPAMKEIAKFYVTDDMVITVSEYTQKQNLNKITSKALVKNDKVQTWMFNNAMRNLLMMRQPLFVHAHTTVGYFKSALQKEKFDHLKAYYDGNLIGKYMHYTVPAHGMNLINRYEVSPDLMSVRAEFATPFAEWIKPQIEQWCNCVLEYTMAYGIWEFKKGTTFNMHVDVLTYRVINAMIVIDKELAGQEDWKMEFITFDGERKWMKFAPGDMFIYEAAKLIHGWPTPFEGENYIAVFFHFFPRNPDWPYYIQDRMFTHNKSGKKMPLETDSSIVKKRKSPYKIAKKVAPKKATAANPEPFEIEEREKKKAEQKKAMREAEKRMASMKKKSCSFEYKLKREL